jgi:hypothetical protein
MMLRLELIEGIRIIIIALLSYLPTVAISGWFEAWVAKKCDDDLPEQLGFLTIDPIIHFNIIGFATLLVGRLFGDYLPFFRDFPGWGRFIPLNPSNLNYSKIIMQFTARAVAHFTMMIVSFFMLVFMVKSAFVSIDITTGATQASSGLAQSLLSVIAFFNHQNFMLCIIYSVIGLYRALLYIFFPEFHMFSTRDIIIAIGVLLIFVFAGSFLFDMLLHQLIFTLYRTFLA